MIFHKIRNKKWIFIISVTVVIAVILAGIIVWYHADRVNKALNSRRFRQVQLKVSLADEEVYIIHKDGNTEYATGMLEQYSYVRDGRKYVLVKEEPYTTAEDNGHWVEYSAEEYDEYEFFDFSMFEQYSRSDFKKVEDYYVPKEEPDVFFKTFFKIQEKEAYTGCETRFYITKGRVERITVDYLYDGEYDMSWEYEFTYKKQSIQIPTETRSGK